jgi:hypothetical protein
MPHTNRKIETMATEYMSSTEKAIKSRLFQIPVVRATGDVCRFPLTTSEVVELSAILGDPRTEESLLATIASYPGNPPAHAGRRRSWHQVDVVMEWMPSHVLYALSVDPA